MVSIKEHQMTSRACKSIACAAAVATVLLFVEGTYAATQFRDEGITAEASIKEYIGSNACSECHQGKYDDWSGKHMSHFVRYRGDITESIPVNLSNAPINGDEIFLIVGDKKKMAFVDKHSEVFPFQYHIGKQKWIKRNEWRNQDYRLRCGSCHTVGFNPKTRQFVELNVGCEACHGPGRKHDENPAEKKMKVPGKTDGHDVLFTCRRCHNERRKHARPIQTFSGVFHGKGR
jgi:hypothetical protein